MCPECLLGQAETMGQQKNLNRIGWAPPCSPGGSDCKASACNAGDPGSIPGSGRSLEKEMATNSSILAWRIPWIEEPGGLLSVGSHESDRTAHAQETSQSAM